MSTKTHEGGEHHESAADHHESAAHHHREAAKHYESGDHEKAGHHAHVAPRMDCMQLITATRPQSTTPRIISKRETTSGPETQYVALWGVRRGRVAAPPMAYGHDD